MSTPVTDDEVAVRAALADLTAGQPPFPAGRFAAVKHRAAMHRRRQLAGGALAVAVAVGLAVGLSQLAGTQHAAAPGSQRAPVGAELAGPPQRQRASAGPGPCGDRRAVRRTGSGS